MLRCLPSWSSIPLLVAHPAVPGELTGKHCSPPRLPSCFCTPKRAVSLCVTHLPQACMIWEMQRCNTDAWRGLENLDNLSSQQPLWFLSSSPPSPAHGFLCSVFTWKSCGSSCVQLIAETNPNVRPVGDPTSVMVGEPGSRLGFSLHPPEGCGAESSPGLCEELV